MKKLLVTGGAGFIGSNFVRYMLNKYPYTIVVLDALTYAGNPENLRDLEEHPNYRFVHGNICDAKIVEPLVAEADYVINFAAETFVDRSIHGAADFIRTDVFGTYTLLEAARKTRLDRYVQISTDEVYGSIDTGSFTEESPLSPNNPYSASKAGGDMMVRSYFVTYGVPTLITRASNNYGPHQYPEKLIPFFATNAIDDLPLPLYGDGKNIRDWLHVDDHCTGIDIVLHHGVQGEIYNIGGDNERTNVEITHLILDHLKKPESLIKRVADRLGHDRRYSVSSEKLKDMGWSPNRKFEEGIRDTIDWYVNNQTWWRTIKEKSEEYKSFFEKNYAERLKR